MKGMKPGVQDGGGGQPNPQAAPVAEKKPTAPAFNILTLIPEDLETASGGNVSAMADKSNPYSDTLINQFQPMFAMLSGAGIEQGNVERLWCGTTRSKGDVIVCVQTEDRREPEWEVSGLVNRYVSRFAPIQNAYDADLAGWDRIREVLDEMRVSNGGPALAAE